MNVKRQAGEVSNQCESKSTNKEVTLALLGKSFVLVTVPRHMKMSKESGRSAKAINVEY